MIVKIQNKIYKIEFCHFEENKLRHTSCKILELIDEEKRATAGSGTSTCNPLDNFTKELGRKKALTRALYDSDFCRKDREYIWKCYFDRKTQNGLNINDLKLRP